MSDISRAKVSASLIGNTRTLGTHLSPEHRTKISAANMGREGHSPSESVRAKISMSKMDHYPTTETRTKMSISHIAQQFGKRRTDQIARASSHGFREWVMRRTPNRCALCGWTEARCDVAHIVDRKCGGDDSLNNIIVLCPNHHRQYDRGDEKVMMSVLQNLVGRI